MCAQAGLASSAGLERGAFGWMMLPLDEALLGCKLFAPPLHLLRSIHSKLLTTLSIVQYSTAQVRTALQLSYGPCPCFCHSAIEP